MANPVIGARNTCQPITGMMTVAAHYAWTIKYPGRQDIQKVTTVEELADTLRVLQLPGLAPAEFLTLDVRTLERGSYFHCEGDDEEWSLTWTKVDEPTVEH